jgi:hypothetical protein
MNARLRRFSSTGLLLLAALSFGCGSDSNSSVLPTVSSLPAEGGPLVPASTTSDFSPLSLTTSGQPVGGGTAADAAAANRAADALFAVVGGGALEAASPTGGAIQDSSQHAVQLAAISTPGDAGGIASDAQTNRLAEVLTARSRQVMALGSTTFTFEEQRLTVRATDGLELTITGVTPIREGESENAPLLGLTISSDVHAVGRLKTTEERRDVDLRIRGFTGRIMFPGENIDPTFDLEVGQGGVSVEGRVFQVRGTVQASGVIGRFTNAAELNALLSGAQLAIKVSNFSADEIFNSLRADITAFGLQVPLRDGPPTVRALYGTADLVPDKAFSQSRDGRVAHVGIDVSPSSPIVFNGEYDGPSSGTAILTIHYAASGQRDTITLVFAKGEPMVSGSRTNLSGLLENVRTQGDTTLASGTARFADGQLTEHEVEVKRRGGRRTIVFRVKVKSSAGVMVLNLVGSVKSDKGLAGTFTRPDDPAASPTTGERTIQQAAADRSGTFKVSADGVLELVDGNGGTIARALMPDGWNRGL